MSTPASTPDPQELRALAVRLAGAGAEVLLEHRRGPVQVSATKSSATDVVTAADLASEAELRRLLATLRPEDAVLGEEEGLVPGTSGLTWVLDPLDGTVNYLYGIGSYAVSVAVVAGEATPGRWRALAGAVRDVTAARTYSAAAGHGADLDGVAIRPSGTTELSQCLLGTGFSYRREVRVQQARAMARLLPQVRDVRRIGAAALDLCLVASGSLDGHVERELKPWDHAAAALVAVEAGAAVRGRGGSAPDDRLTFAAAPGVAEALWSAVRDSGYLDADSPRTAPASPPARG